MDEIERFVESLKSELTIDKIPLNPAAFITKDKKLFPISIDTKLLSKLMEITSITYIKQKVLPINTDWQLFFPTAQNMYPDLIFINRRTGKKFAADFKSAYLKNDENFSGFTLGSYNGYFKNYKSRCCKSLIGGNIQGFSYNQFEEHYLICYLYERKEEERLKMYSINEMSDLDSSLEEIKNQIKIKHVIITHKWKAARKIAGSGNTANIGSTKSINDLINGISEFSSEEEFLEFWRYRFNHNDALRRIRKVHKDFEVPYTNFDEYVIWCNNGRSNKDFLDSVLELF